MIVGIDPGVTGAVAVVERVNAMPGEGPAGAFSFGHGAGVLEGVLAALGIPVQQVTPQTWKRHYGLGGQPKSAALAVAARLYPTAPLARRRDIGLADALLIARYGVR